MKRIALLISGSGSNAENIIKYFKDSADVQVALVLSDNKNAYGLERARGHNVSNQAFTRADFLKTEKVLDLLKVERIDFIVLAGFLCFVPSNITEYYKDNIINIHPSLLPKYAGKGMYGHFVHEAVVAAQDTESGISIHYVNERFDEGEIIFQAKCEVLPTDTAADVERKVRALEIEHFPRVIEEVLNK